MFKKIISAVLCSAILIISAGQSFAEPEIFGDTGVIINAETGQVLYDKEKDKIMYPASTTKILTAIVALENSEMTDKVIVDDKTPVEVWGGHIALEAGEELTMEQLMEALMLNSANDAAMVIARHIGGTIEGFSDMMNSKAKEIGAVNTHYRNPSGLPDKEHTTTAYDLAKMAQYGLKNGYFRYFVSKVEGYIPPTNKKTEGRYLLNSNKLLYSDKMINVDGNEVPMKYEGITGVKTGYTDDAQNCLVSSAKRGDNEYIAVVMHSNLNNVYIDSQKLLNYAFDQFSHETILYKDDELAFKYDDKDLIVKVPNDIKHDFKYETIVNESPDVFERFGIEKEFIPDEAVLDEVYYEGDKVGEVVFTQNGNEIARTDVNALEDKKGLEAFLKGKKNTDSSSVDKLNEVSHVNIFLSILIVGIIIILIIASVRMFIRKRNMKKRQSETLKKDDKN